MQSSAQSEPMAHTNGYSESRDYYDKPGAHPTTGSQSASDDRSPSRGLSNLSFLKDLASDKKQTKGTFIVCLIALCLRLQLLMDTADGQPPKRRGPKPDSKPALTRRQELNRQAQR